MDELFSAHRQRSLLVTGAAVFTLLLLAPRCQAQSGCTDCGETGWLTNPAQPAPGTASGTQPFATNGRILESLQDNLPTPVSQGQPQGLASSVFDGGADGMLTDRSTIPGYIEWAAPQNQFRMRFDAGFDNSFPDRAEFFYARAGGPGPGDANRAVFNTGVDYYDARAYLEVGENGCWSVFTEVPVRWLRTDSTVAAPSGNTGGLGDVEAGIKYAMVNDDDRIVTFMLKGYFPTGDAGDGLGTDHYSIEPGLLFQQKLSDRAVVFGELRDWIPIDGTNFAGNVLRYGVGTGYTVVDNGSWTMTPIAEIVGWSVLDGLQTNPGTLAAQGAETTIVNLKLGVRVNFPGRGGVRDGRSLYVGWGHALTTDEWYQDLLRVDYSVFF